MMPGWDKADQVMSPAYARWSQNSADCYFLLSLGSFWNQVGCTQLQISGRSTDNNLTDSFSRADRQLR